MTMTHRVSALFATAWLAGCASSPVPSYFALDPGASPARVTGRADDRGAIILVGPVHVPERIDRAQIVLVGEGHRVLIRQQDRWAEPIADGITRTLARVLAGALPGHAVMPAGILAPANAWRLAVDVTAMDARTDGRVDLALDWTLQSLQPAAPVALVGQERIATAATADGTEAMVGAMRSAIEQAATRIAARIEGAVPAVRPRD